LGIKNKVTDGGSGDGLLPGWMWESRKECEALKKERDSYWEF
jgi:hypothetical protein